MVSSQVDLHARYGGVVPEIASRAHVELLTPVVAEALVEAASSDGDIDAVAATDGPGLVGALLVGVSAAKALALVWDVPFVAVNHLEAHLYAGFLEDPDLELPLVVLLVSGGHTMLVAMEGHGRYRLLGSTLDDAAGEAFDKVARYLGLGYPGGPAIDRHLRSRATRRPSPSPGRCSTRASTSRFSGLKTVGRSTTSASTPTSPTADVAASFQEAVVDVLVAKARRAAEEIGAKGLCLGGGVAANSLLRERFLDACAEDGLHGLRARAGRCAPTTPRWSRPPAGGGSRPTARAPLDTGADPNLACPV